MGTKHFGSTEKYHRWLAYGHIHGDFARTPGVQKIYIRGKLHKVKHKR